jgi:hypothetical protein
MNPNLITYRPDNLFSYFETKTELTSLDIKIGESSINTLEA